MGESELRIHIYKRHENSLYLTLEDTTAMNPLRFHRCLSVGAFLIFLINLSAVAQKTRSLTLEESIEIAKQSNLTLQTAEQNLKTAEAQVRTARAGLLPRITANGNYTYFKDIQKSVIQAEGGFGFPMPGGETSETPPASTDNEADLIELEFGAHHNLQGALNLTQPIFAWGRYYYGYQAAKLNYQAVQQDVNAAYNQLRLDVSEAFYGALIAQEFVRVAQQSVTLVEKQLGIAETSLQAGAATDFDVLRAKVQLANAKSQLVRLDNAAVTAKDAYKTILNIPLAEDVSVKGTLEIPEKQQMPPLNLDILIEQALKNRPEVHRTQFSEDAARKQVDVAKRDDFLTSVSSRTIKFHRTKDSRR